METFPWHQIDIKFYKKSTSTVNMHYFNKQKFQIILYFFFCSKGVDEMRGWESDRERESVKPSAGKKKERKNRVWKRERERKRKRVSEIGKPKERVRRGLKNCMQLVICLLHITTCTMYIGRLRWCNFGQPHSRGMIKQTLCTLSLSLSLAKLCDNIVEVV
jgi:hypothetical protein